MKILALGDVHLGASPDLGRVPFGEGSRLHDQAIVLSRVHRVAVDEGVDLVLFAGDAFHRRRPTPSEILVWRGFVELLNRDGIDMIAIDGNHDVESADRPSALETVKTQSGYEVARTPRIIGSGGLVRVATLPWTPPARLIAQLSEENVERDEVNAVVADLLIDSARELRENIAAGKNAILLAHWSVSGSSLPNGIPVDQLREPVLPLPELEALGYDAIVLGHIHKSQLLSPGRIAPDSNGSHVVDAACPIFYTGSSALVDFGEAQTPHGVWILDDATGPDRDEGDVRFVPIDDRRFVTVDCDLTQDSSGERAESQPDPRGHARPGDGGGPDDQRPGMGARIPGALPLDETDAIAAEIASHFPLNDAVVRIRYRATSEQARHIDVAALRSLCADAGVHKVYAIQAQIERDDRQRAEGLDETLTTMDALEVYVKSESVPPAKADELRSRTASYLEEVAAT